MAVLADHMYGACVAVHGVTHSWHIADVPTSFIQKIPASSIDCCNCR